MQTKPTTRPRLIRARVAERLRVAEPLHFPDPVAFHRLGVSPDRRWRVLRRIGCADGALFKQLLEYRPSASKKNVNAGVAFRLVLEARSWLKSKGLWRPIDERYCDA